MLSTFEATPNIALIKYWGKRDRRLVLPQNGSISFTLGNDARTVTTVSFSKKHKGDAAWLNGKKARPEELERMKIILDLVRKEAGIGEHASVWTGNNFPTKAGIASSASGFAALACAASDAAGLKLKPAQLSILARRASGSASRSVLGGFVEWKKGVKADGSDSYSVQIAPASHWPHLRDIIAIVESGSKKVGSSEGMDRTVRTSALFRMRVERMPRKLERMREAIMSRNAHEIYALAMEDSNDMHATMADTKPPIVYLNDTSRMIKQAVNEINGLEGKFICGYTFDAGPNAHIITERKYASKIRERLSEISGIEKFIECGIGDGPRKLGEIERLLTFDGKPAKSA